MISRGFISNYMLDVSSICMTYAPFSYEFQFRFRNHSVGWAEYQQPCIPYKITRVNRVGIFSGFFPLDKILPNFSQSSLPLIALITSVVSHQYGALLSTTLIPSFSTAQHRALAPTIR